ncbi:glutathione S-transferase N-terminal domain-containing protein [Aquicella lusitana]|uniref:GST-like protein n=1 Tax=Aquicella lusitana TaxID=254246 RepID=A0A370GPD5_9COXI|nr:glutathione S-transferase N-terminal domain-containing protein [Aquicella lusitana]RDI45219.1 GST-like protein [Aquicella lusitana]VVC72711.1 Disulfide-bond oxidoreductase YfcG [Aquicella lusitana]
MIDFYTWKTPNGHKVAIMLEETGLPYQVHPIDLTRQEQYQPAYLKINPNNKIPAIIDQEGPHHRPFRVFESGAILLYLAEKTGRFLPSDPCRRMEAIEWLMFQVSGVGPMLGQLHHFLHFAAEKVPYAIERYANEARRLYHVMEQQLEKERYFAGDYSIADMAIFPWIHAHERQHIDLTDYPCLQRWHHTILERPAVQKGLHLLSLA